MENENVLAEVNLVESLIFDLSRGKNKSDPCFKKRNYKTLLPNGDIQEVDVSINFNKGPLGILDFDVLNAIVTFSALQGVCNPIFKFSEILSFIGYQADNTLKIKKSIEKLRSTEVNFKKGFYCKRGDSYTENGISFNVLSSYSYSQNIIKGVVERDGHQVTIPKEIFKSIISNNILMVSREKYSHLKTAGAKRLIYVLESLRVKRGNNFIMDVSYIADILGLKDKYKFVVQINSYLEEIKEVFKNIEFEIFKKEKRVNVAFSQIAEIEEGEDQKVFLAKLLNYYGPDYLQDISINHSFLNDCEENALYCDIISFDKFNIKKYQLFLDKILFQYEKSNKKIGNIYWILKKAIDNNYTVSRPGYIWLDERLEKKKSDLENSTIQQKKEIEENKKIETKKNVKLKKDKYLREIENVSPQYYQQIKSEAIGNIKNRKKINPDDETCNLQISLHLDDEVLKIHKKNHPTRKDFLKNSSVSPKLEKHGNGDSIKLLQEYEKETKKILSELVDKYSPNLNTKLKQTLIENRKEKMAKCIKKGLNIKSIQELDSLHTI